MIHALAILLGVAIVIRLSARTSLAAGVRLDGLAADGIAILGAIDRAARTFQVDLVVTSAVRLSESGASLHATGRAIDVRTKTLTTDQKIGLYYWLKHELPGFTVLYEVPPGQVVAPELASIVYRNSSATAEHFHIAGPR